MLALRLVAVALVSSFLACSASDDVAPVTAAPAPAPTTPAPTGGESDGGSDAGSASDAAAATAVALTNLTLAGHPHAIDVFVPSNATRALVFLHGGGGSKEGGALQIGARTDDAGNATPDVAWLVANRVAVVVPQGQNLPSAAKAPTWSTYVMTSGVDDVAFLTALAGALRGGTLDARVPATLKVFLAGHSNGGMMANRMWCEAPAAFDAYGALSGPASVQLAPTALGVDSGGDPLASSHPCAPSVAKPFDAVVGVADTIVGGTADASAAAWSVNSCLRSGAGTAFVDPLLVNERRWSAFRATRVCGAAPDAPTTKGNVTTYAACAGQVELHVVAGAEHCITAGKMVCLGNKILPSECTNSLEARSGTRMRDLLATFFASVAP